MKLSLQCGSFRVRGFIAFFGIKLKKNKICDFGKGDLGFRIFRFEIFVTYMEFEYIN